MPATTTEGTGLGSVTNVKPPIINGTVKNVNLKLEKTSGEVVKVNFYMFDDGVLTNNSDTYTDFATVTYNPVLESSYILVEYHATYAINGADQDEFRSRITVNGNEITWRSQI